ncbi:MAG: hypothetical protein Tsb0016_21880 [Sphingomonadales bacterium]
MTDQGDTTDLRKLGDPGSSDFQLDAYPFYLLNRTVSRYNTIIEAELRRIGLDVPTWRVLMILGEKEPRPIARVADAAVINISTMARIIDRMIAAGLIDALPSQNDRRVKELVLTDQGRDRLAAARRVTAPIYRRLIAGFSAREFQQLQLLLNRIYANLD